jgi:hypothetical protein
MEIMGLCFNPPYLGPVTLVMVTGLDEFMEPSASSISFTDLDFEGLGGSPEEDEQSRQEMGDQGHFLPFP